MLTKFCEPHNYTVDLLLEKSCPYCELVRLRAELEEVKDDRDKAYIAIKKALDSEEATKILMVRIEDYQQENADLRRALELAFVQGAKFWEYGKEGATMWQGDQDICALEARRRAENGTLGKERSDATG